MLLGRVRRTIRERRLLPAGARVVVACSGGPDSAVLLDVLAKLAAELDLRLVAASVDHCLRPDSARDVGVAEALATRLGVPFRTLSVDVSRREASLQASARRARYAALSALAAELGASAIAVGHTRDDQAETVLARLLRGAGPRGLAGIAPRRADGVVRPLVDCRRADVHAWAQREGLPVIRDPSNDDRRFLRVRIRHTILPALATEDPAIVDHLSDLADDMRDASGLVARRARRAMKMMGRERQEGERQEGERQEGENPGKEKVGGQGSGRLAVEMLRRLDRPTLREVLRVHLSTRPHIVAVEEVIRSGKGEVRLPGDRIATVERGFLVVRPTSPLRKQRVGPTLSNEDEET